MISLRTKMGLIVIVVMALFIGLNLLVLRAVVFPALRDIEENEAKEDVFRCLEAVRQEVRGLDAVCEDLTGADETVAILAGAVMDVAPEDVAAHLAAAHDVDLICVFDAEGKLLLRRIAKRRPSGEVELVALRGFTDDGLPTTHALIRHRAVDSRRMGVLITEEGGLLISSRPIPVASQPGKITGVLIVGRFLDGRRSEKIRQAWQVDFGLQSAAGFSVPVTEMQAMMETGAGRPFVLQNEEDDELTAGVFMLDVNGVASVLLRARVTPLKSYGLLALRFALITVVAMGLLAILIMLFIFRRTLTAPLATLSNHVSASAIPEEAGADRDSGKPGDEISRITTEFDHLMRHLKRYEENLDERELRLIRQNDQLVRLAKSKSIARGEMTGALRQIVEAASDTLEIDRVSVWLFDDGHTAIRCADAFDRHGRNHTSGDELIVSDFPRYFELVEQERIISAPDVRSDFRLRRMIEERLEQRGVQSLLHVPLRRGGHTVGILSLDHCNPVQEWPVEVRNFACSMGDLVSLALETSQYRRTEEALERSSRIMEAVAFAAERLLKDPPLENHLDDILSTFGEATGATFVAAVRVEVTEDGERVVNVPFGWAAPNAARLEEAIAATEELWHTPTGTRWLSLLKDGNIIAGNQDDFADEQREALQAWSIPSIAVIPISVGQDFWGMMQFHASSQQPDWSSPEIESLQAAGSILGEAMHRQQAEEMRAKLSAAVNQAVEGIMITDPSGMIQYVNPAFERISGYAVQEVLGKNPGIIKSGRNRNSLYRELWSTIQGGNVWMGRLVNRRKDGTEYQEECTISPVKDASGQIVCFVAVKRDVTRQVELEAQLRQAQKMEAVGQLAGGVAHDFNNLMTVIVMNAECINLLVSDDSPVRPNIDEIINAAEHAGSLTKQLLTFARRQTFEPEILDINSVLAQIDRMLRRLLREDIELVVSPGDNLRKVRADRGHIQQVLLNLAVNARDAMESGGAMVIRTANTTIAPGSQLAVSGITPGEYVALTVTDTGVGMTQEVQSRIFEPFFTTKGPEKGTGLGLATVYGIVKQHGGQVTVSSEPSQGTTFQVFLPCVGEETLFEDKVPQKEHLPTGDETILFVEDYEALRTVTTQMLKRLGYTVLDAENGQQAFEMAEAHRGEIHLLIADVVMPILNGPDLAMKLIRSRPGLRVIFASGYGNDFEFGDIDTPNVMFIQKPLDPVSLSYQVREILDAPPHVPASVGT